MEITHLDFLAFLSFAVLGSFGHCAGMCGGIVLSYSTHLTQNKFLAHLLYGLGKTSSYIILGILAASLGNIFTFSTIAHAILWILLAIIMFLMGFSLILQNSWLSRMEKISIKLPTQRIFQYALSSKNLKGIFLLGVANGFLPCGLVYIALMNALSTQSILMGGVLMAIFGLTTLLPLLFIGILASHLHEMKWRNVLLRIAGAVVLVFGCFYFSRAITLITAPIDSPQETLHKHH